MTRTAMIRRVWGKSASCWLKVVATAAILVSCTTIKTPLVVNLEKPPMAATLPTDRTPTFRPSAADLSLAVHNANTSAPLQWYHGVTATQVQRDGVEEGLTGIAMPRVLNFAKAVGCSSSDIGYGFSTYSKITAKLGSLYEAQAMKNGVWNVRVNGNHYGFEYYVEEKIQTCAVDSHRAALCATIISPAVADYLNVRVENGRCVLGAGLVIFAPSEPYNSTRGNLGQVDVKTPAPIPVGQQAQLLTMAVAAHNALDPSTGARRIATEDSATSEAQQHFFRSKDFMGDCDPAWPDACHGWHLLQNRFMTLWMQKVQAGDWFAARQADADHQLSHICAAVKDDRLLVLFSCPAGLGRSGSMDRCGIMTCQQALGVL